MKPDLRELALRHGKSQSELGVSQPHASLIMNGRLRAGADAREKIAAALKIEVVEVSAACDESLRRALATSSARSEVRKQRTAVARKGRRAVRAKG